MPPYSDSGVYDFDATLAEGQPFRLSSLRGQVLLIVNTASQCGFTPQYEGLQHLFASYAARGFSVLGFPCNQFGAQEPGSEVEICSFAANKYHVNFPLFVKIDVNGPKTPPLFEFLKRSRRGIFGTSSIKWNFTKFLIDRQGKVVARFSPFRKPEKLVSAIEKLLESPERPF